MPSCQPQPPLCSWIFANGSVRKWESGSPHVPLQAQHAYNNCAHEAVSVQIVHNFQPELRASSRNLRLVAVGNCTRKTGNLDLKCMDAVWNRVCFMYAVIFTAAGIVHTDRAARFIQFSGTYPHVFWRPSRKYQYLERWRLVYGNLKRT